MSRTTKSPPTLARRPQPRSGIRPKGSAFFRRKKHPIRPTSLRPQKPGRWQAGAQNQAASTTQPPGAISRNTLVIDQGTAHSGPRPVGEIKRPRGSSAQGRSLWPSPHPLARRPLARRAPLFSAEKSTLSGQRASGRESPDASKREHKTKMPAQPSRLAPSVGTRW